MFDVEVASQEVERVRRLAGDVVETRDTRWFLRRAACGDCVLRQSDSEGGRCGLHAEHGLEAKPQRCQDFPFRALRTAAGTFLGASFACQAIVEGHGPMVGAATANPTARDLPAVPLAPGHPFHLATYLEWESLVLRRMGERGRDGLAGAAGELAARVGSVASADSVSRALRTLEHSLLTLAEGPWSEPGGEERLDAMLVALQEGGKYASSVVEGRVDVADVRRRWEVPWSQWPLALPFFEHLLFRKYLLEGPDVLSRVASLPILADLLQFWALARAEAPSRAHVHWAIRQLEQRLTFHARGGEAFFGHFAAAYQARLP